MPGFTNVAGVNTSSNQQEVISSTANRLNVGVGITGGERNTTSQANNYDVIKEECNITILSDTSAHTIGAGAADDTFLMGILILLNAAAATATIAGFQDHAGAAANIVLTGSTSVDTYYNFKASRNIKGALTVTGSVASKVIVFWRPI